MYSVIGVVCTLVMTYLNKQANIVASPIEGDLYKLRLNKLYWYVGICCIVLAALIFIGICLTVEFGIGWLIGLFFLIFFGGLGSILALWYVNHKFDFDLNKIEATSFYGNKTSLKWEEIKSIKFKALSGLLIFEGNNGEKVKAHQHLVGFIELQNAIENNTAWKIRDLNLPYK